MLNYWQEQRAVVPSTLNEFNIIDCPPPRCHTLMRGYRSCYAICNILPDPKSSYKVHPSSFLKSIVVLCVRITTCTWNAGHFDCCESACVAGGRDWISTRVSGRIQDFLVNECVKTRRYWSLDFQQRPADIVDSSSKENLPITAWVLLVLSWITHGGRRGAVKRPEMTIVSGPDREWAEGVGNLTAVNR